MQKSKNNVVLNENGLVCIYDNFGNRSLFRSSDISRLEEVGKYLEITFTSNHVKTISFANEASRDTMFVELSIAMNQAAEKKEQ